MSVHPDAAEIHVRRLGVGVTTAVGEAMSSEEWDLAIEREQLQRELDAQHALDRLAGTRPHVTPTPASESTSHEYDSTSHEMIDKRVAFHTPSPEGTRRVDILRRAYSELFHTLRGLVPASHEGAMAHTELEASAMWGDQGGRRERPGQPSGAVKDVEDLESTL